MASVGSNPVRGFGIFRGFGWVRSSALINEPGFGRVRILVFSDLFLGSACFCPNRFKVRALFRGSTGF